MHQACIVGFVPEALMSVDEAEWIHRDLTWVVGAVEPSLAYLARRS